ncbi:MAG TPA: FGGY-family carbohydrate kinase [Acidimicrobiales bacterium]|nr:FGGY-family carbohydrate kinase [Acidimicrobiales bacterium]
MRHLLVLDVGTTGVRATLVDEEGLPGAVRYRRTAPSRPAAGVSEFDPAALAAAALAVAGEALSGARVAGVAVANQRASTVLWDAADGRPLGPGLGWQDLRTVGQCLALRASGLRLAPNQSATKLAYLLGAAGAGASEPRFGTLDTFIAWHLSGGALHVTDASNAGVTGLLAGDGSGWDPAVLSALGLDEALLPAIVASSALLGEASALPGAPPIAGLVGDQQASLIGQGCVLPGAAKATFGTGGMLDLCVGGERPAFAVRGEAGTFPIVAWRLGEELTWGIEAILLAAGSCVEWLRDGLGLIERVEDSSALAASVRDSGGVTFVPAFGGLGTPAWDFGARGTLVGLDQSTTRAEIVHAVLDGIAQCGADLLEAVESDGGCRIEHLCIDGGMSTNATFVQLLADATGRPVLVSAVSEATTLGAAFLGGSACGLYPSLAGATGLIGAPRAVEPRRRADRGRWLDARERALRTVPLLSALEF